MASPKRPYKDLTDKELIGAGFDASRRLIRGVEGAKALGEALTQKTNPATITPDVIEEWEGAIRSNEATSKEAAAELRAIVQECRTRKPSSRSTT